MLKTTVQRLAFRLTGNRFFWVGLIGLAFALPIARSVGRQLPPPPPVYGQLPAFQLQDQDGKPFGLADLRGHVWVADFIFTSCAEACPRLSQRMSDLQYHLRNVGNAAHLVSFSVDPQRDTPLVLRAYADRYHARHDMWTFLTGPLDVLQSTIVDGFKIAMQRTAVEDTGFFDIVHGERFVLVDQEGRIRGYYAATDDGIQELLNNLGLLANLGPHRGEAQRAVSASGGAPAKPLAGAPATGRAVVSLKRG